MVLRDLRTNGRTEVTLSATQRWISQTFKCQGKDESGGWRIFQVSRAEVAAELSSLLTTLGGCVLKIQRSANGRVVFKLSGRIEAEDVKELQQLFALEPAGPQLTLDLRDVTLVNQEAVEFLASCEAASIELQNCPLYIREWIERGKGQTR